MEPLSVSPVGKKQEIKWITGNNDETAVIRNVGMNEGSLVKIPTAFDGNVIVAIDELRYAIGRELAFRIKVG